MEDHKDPYYNAELLLRYLRKEITANEEKEVEAWLNGDENNRKFLAQLQSEEGLIGEKDFFDQSAKDIAWAEIQKAIGPEPRRLWPRIAVAASIMLFLLTGGYYLLKMERVSRQTTKQYTNDIAPGHDQATLTLANGQKIVLAPGLKGRLALQGATTIDASAQGLSYGSANNNKQVSENTLTTAKGERSPYPLILADGTKVWLNAESSLTFPTAFPGGERVVKLAGEAFFEVNHNSTMPFKVKTGLETIEDIGTQFNVKAYDDEQALATTLIEGSIKVSTANKTTTPKPGEQVLLADNELTTSDANVKEVLAWKNGYFRFNDAPITTIMRELARWYNIEVVYEGKVSQERFTAKISRYKNISAVLTILEKTKSIHFKIEGRRVTVLNKN